MIKTPRNNDKKDNQVILQFAEVAENFCFIIDNHDNFSPKEFVYKIADLLIHIYSTGLSLPEVKSFDFDQENSERITAIECTKICKEISQKLGKYNFYWNIFDPFEKSEPGCQMLGDDLADIYRDLKSGLMAYRRGTKTDINLAHWEWRFGFYNHFGDHITDSLRALNRIINGYLL